MHVKYVLQTTTTEKTKKLKEQKKKCKTYDDKNKDYMFTCNGNAKSETEKYNNKNPIIGSGVCNADVRV